ncbi:hypothetical protein [Sphaerimonospora mesophila]|uniref:hypothetical protein n=1 Tax=Sphaerimonospora mesophila TaxID=37483 RepID=UPI000A996DDF
MTHRTNAENPALNPDRRWDQHPGAQIEATLLVRILQPLQRKVLHVLAESPAQVERHDHLSRKLNVGTDEVSAAVARINQFAESYGYVPLIVLHDSGYEIESATAEVVRHALTEQQR